MVRKITNAVGAMLIIALSLFLWARLYTVTDWSVLALVPLAALLFAGLFWSSAAVSLASIKVAVKQGSVLFWTASGSTSISSAEQLTCVSMMV